MRIKNKKLFFAYALPCIRNLVKKRKVSGERARKLISDYEKGKKLPEGTEKIFEVALFYLNKIAKMMGKKVIDDEVIIKYFQEYHNELLKGKNLDICKIRFGEVVKVQKKYVLVKTGGRIKRYKTFLNDLKEGDQVVLHWDYIVDKMEKIKILVFGNSLVKKDSLALKIAGKLRYLPNFEFKEFDTAENLEKEGKIITILDVVDGLKKVEVLKDLKKIERNRIFSLHDFDLSYELKLLKKLKLIEKFQIIGIPLGMEEGKVLNQIKRILSDPSYF